MIHSRIQLLQNRCSDYYSHTKHKTEEALATRIKVPNKYNASLDSEILLCPAPNPIDE